jgi:hypothetical protein
VVLDFERRYTPNRNPAIAALDGPMRVAPGAVVRFTARWDAASAETFPVLAGDALALVDTREALRVSWFATAGAFVTEVTGRAADDPELSTKNEWAAPASAGPVHMWLALRDSRGGVDVLARTISGEP